MDIDDEVGIEKSRIHFRKQFINIISIAGRQWVFIIVPLGVGIIISTAVAFSLPKIYESRTLILVEKQKVPESIVKSAISGTAQDRLSTIKQQVLSRTFLKKIVDKFDLYGAKPPGFINKTMRKLGVSLKTKPTSIEGKINHLRKNILVRTSGGRRLNSFAISYSGQNPTTVMKVTNELASLVMEENLRIREGFVEGATVFLDGELSKLKAQLELQEEKLGNYKRSHMGALPEQLETNLRALDRFQSRLESISQEKESAKIQVLELGGKLNIEKRRITAQGGMLTGGKEIPPVILRRLHERRELLRQLLLEYNEEYPDVVILREDILKLEEEGERLARDRTIDSRAELTVLSIIKKDLFKARRDLRRLSEKEQEVEENIVIYEQRVENAPKLEQELIILSRNYDKISGSYQSLLDKKLNANIFESLEKRQKGGQFRIIDPAIISEIPIKPNKPIIIFMGSVLGFGAGIGFVFFREKLDSTIRQPEEIEKILSTLVLASIPDTTYEYIRKEARN